MAKVQRSNREIRKPKKTAAQRSSEQPVSVATVFLKQERPPKKKR